MGTACLTMVCATGCMEISGLAPAGTSLLLLHWPRCVQGCFSHFFSHLSYVCCATFFPFLKYVISETNVSYWLSSVQWWVRLGDSCNCLCPAWGQLLAASRRSHLHSTYTPLLAKACHVNPGRGIPPDSKFAFTQEEKLMAIIKNYIPNIAERVIKNGWNLYMCSNNISTVKLYKGAAPGDCICPELQEWF